MPITAAAAALSGSTKALLSAALLAHPAPAVAEWTQASDGPVFDSAKTSVNRQPDKAVFLRPKVSPTGGVALPARLGTRLVTRYQHPAHPTRLIAQQVAFCLNQEPETMTTTTPGQSAQDLNKPATMAEAHQRIDVLGNALEFADALSQCEFTAVKAVARLTLLALESPEAYRSHTTDLIPDALRLIWSLSDQAMDGISSTVQRAARSFSDPSEDARDTARRNARSAAVIDLASEGAAA